MARSTLRKLPLLAKVALAGFVLASAALGLLSAAASLPTRLEPLLAAEPAFARQLQTQGGNGACGLNEQPVGDACEALELSRWGEIEVKFGAPSAGSPPTTLRGTLTVPGGLDGPRPAAVLMHGSGPSDRHAVTRGGLVVRHPPFRLLEALARELGRQGLVTLRYDKRSCHRCYPAAPFDAAAFRFEQFEDDALDALRFLAERPEVDPSAMVLIGHSQGGQLAPFVAKRFGSLRAVVMLAATTETLEHGLLGQLERMATIRRRQLDLLGAWQLDEQRERYARCFDRLRLDFRPLEQCIGGGVTQQALGQHVNRAPLTFPRIRSLDCPLLALQGNLDRNINPGALRQLAELLPPERASVQMLQGVGHSLTDGLDPADPPDLASSVKRALRGFLARIPR
jgi:pimeloyl-ACP methyl ester carboxylesterase